MEKAFKTVKEYLYKHEEATILDIVKDTGIAEKYVLDFLKEGRLNIEGSEDVLRCEDCGQPISSGRYCSVCRDKLASALSGVVKKENNSPGWTVQAKMHARYGRD
jgi:Zn finger protein HypA/HybF involved in hydrogenase expression